MGVSVVAFSLKDKFFEHDEYKISDNLRKLRWIVPAYTMAPDAQHITLLRVVVREYFNRTQAEKLAQNIEMVLQELEAHHPKIMKAVAMYSRSFLRRSCVERSLVCRAGAKTECFQQQLLRALNVSTVVLPGLEAKTLPSIQSLVKSQSMFMIVAFIDGFPLQCLHWDVVKL